MNATFARSILAALALLLLLAGCGRQPSAQQPTAQPVPTAQPGGATAQPGGATAQPGGATAVPTAQPGGATAVPTAQPAPTNAPAARPTFAFEPRAGAPGTVVNLRGWGFKPNSMVGVYLGTPSPVGTAMASAHADAAGGWQLSVTIPANLPKGDPVPAGNVYLVAMDERYQPLASAAFGFQAPAPMPQYPPLSQASENVTTLLVAYGTADITPYLAQALRQPYQSGQALPTLIGFDPMTMQGKPQVGPARQLPKGAVVEVPVTVRLERSTDEFLFTLLVEDGFWKLNSTQLLRTTPLPPPPTPVDETPAAEPGRTDAVAIGQLIYSQLRSEYGAAPGMLAGAYATAGEHAVGLVWPAGQIPMHVFYKRVEGGWRTELITPQPTPELLRSLGIPTTLAYAQPAYSVIIGTLGMYGNPEGDLAEGYVLIERMADLHARVTIVDGAQGEITGYLRDEGNGWRLLITGQVFAPEALDELNIPASVR